MLVTSALALHLYARVEAPAHWLGFGLLVPWIAWLERTKTLSAALGTALVMSLAFALGVFSWFGSAIAFYADTSPWVGYVALLALAPVLQPQLFVYALARHAARSWAAHRRCAPLLIALPSAATYVGAEWALPKLFGDTLGHGLHASAWLRQAADLAGVPLLTLALLLGNEAIFRALEAARSSVRAAALYTLGAFGLVAVLAGYGAWRQASLAPTASQTVLLRAALVQADLSGYARMRAELGSYGAVRRILDEHFELSLDAPAPVDVVLWPETVYPTTFGAPKSEAGAELDAEIEDFVVGADVSLIFGAYDVQGDDEFNAAFFLSPRGHRAVYRKAALFPLTERVPAWLDTEPVRSRMPWLGTWRPGDGPRVVPFELPDGRVLRAGPLICYDAVEPRFARAAALGGAQLLVTLSNDSWFATGAGPNLHLVVSAFRSIETRRPQLRVTNTGITAWIDVSGEIRGRLGVHERGVSVATVPVGGEGSTLVMRWGEWLAPTTLVAALVSLLWLYGSRPRARSRSSR